MNHSDNHHAHRSTRIKSEDSITAIEMNRIGENSELDTQNDMGMSMKLAKMARIDDASESPAWMVYNDYIDYGYRIDYTNNNDLMRSVFMLHNETMNVWTHMVGAVIFMFLLYNTFVYFDPWKLVYEKFSVDLSETNWGKYSSGLNYSNFLEFVENLKKHGMIGFTEFQNFYTFWRDHNPVTGTESKFTEMITELMRTFPETFTKISSPNFGDIEAFKALFRVAHFKTLIYNIPKSPLLIFEVCAIACLVLSSIMHIFWVKDPKTCEKLHKLDLTGIVIMIFGSSISCVYFQFYCMDWYLNIYITLNIIAASLSIYVMNGSNEFIRNSRLISAGVYTLQASMAFIPYYHWYELSQKGHPHSLDLAENVHWILAEILSYFIGAVFYVTRVPEKWITSKLQLWINSHSIFHIFVFIGALAHFFAVEKILFSRLENSCTINHGFGY